LACANTQAQIYNVAAPAVGFVESVDTPGTIAWLFRKELTACLDTLIAEQATGGGLTDEERSRQTAETADKLLAVE
jgi:hypothetical protein